MEAESIFIKQLEGYLNLEFNDYDKGRILGYLGEYKGALPPPPPKVITTEKVVYRDLKTKKTTSPDYKGIYPDPYEIIGLISIVSGITTRQLIGKDRYANVVLARHVAMYLIRTICNRTLKDVGTIFNRDHTTTIASINHVTTLLELQNESCIKFMCYVSDNLKMPTEKTA